LATSNCRLLNAQPVRKSHSDPSKTRDRRIVFSSYPR